MSGVRDKSHSICMQSVFTLGYPFKVLNTIIMLISVNMVYLRLVIWVFNKGPSDKYMHHNSLFWIMKMNFKVIILTRIWRK